MPKAAGGVRPIALFPSEYRIWTKARLPLVEQWEREHDRAFFACGPKQSASDVVWKQTLRAEASVSEGGFAAALLWDLQSFFDTIDFELL